MPTGFSQLSFLIQFHFSMIHSGAPMDASSACDIINGVIVIYKSALQKQLLLFGTFVVPSDHCDRKMGNSSTPYDQFITPI